MQITLIKKTIQNLVSGFNKVITVKNPLPVLDHVCFVISRSHGARVIASDLDNILVRSLDPAEMEMDDGDTDTSFLFPFSELKKLRDSIKAGDAATLRPLANGQVEVKAGLVSRTFEPLPADDFPLEMPEVPLTACNGNSLLQAMAKAAVTVADSNDTRHYLTGIYADPRSGAFIGTDARRLTLATLPDYPLKDEAIIPVGPAFKFMVSQAGTGQDGLVGILVEKENRRFELRSGLWQWQARCIQGTYPNYRQVIPPEKTSWIAECVFSDDAAAVLIEVARQLPTADQQTVVNLALSEKGVLVFAPDNQSFVGVTLPDCRVESEGMALVGVNRDYLTDTLKQGFRRVRVGDPLSPMLFNQSSGDLHVVMPLREAVTPKAEEYAARMLGVEITRSGRAESEPESVPAPETANAPEIETETETETQANSKETIAMTTKPQPLQQQTEDDPVKELSRLVAETQENIRTATGSLREIKKQAVALERHFKGEERKIRSREQDMARNLKLIEKLQEAVAA